MDVEDETAFNEAVQEFQQQFVCYREVAGRRFQELEELIELAARKMEILQRRKVFKKRIEVFVNLFGSSEGVTTKSKAPLHHLRLKFPEFEGAEISECLQDCEHQLAGFGIGNMTQEWPNPTKEENVHATWKEYIGEPIYDEEPDEGQECWPEQEFILAALRGDNSDSSKPLQSEICTSKRSEELAAFLNIQDFQQGQGNNIQKIERARIQLKEVFSLIPTSTEIVEAFHSKRLVKDFPTAEISYDLGMRSSNFGKGNMFIFDPGGQVQNKLLEGVPNKFKNMFRSEVKLEEAVMKISLGGELRPWEDIGLDFQAIEQLWKGHSQWPRKVFIIDIGNSARLQGQSFQKVSDQFDKIVDEINQQNVYSVIAGMIVIPCMCTGLRPGSFQNTRRLEDHNVSRIRVLITIFDPGGQQNCASDAQLVSGTVGILHIQHLLQEVKRSWTCMIHHEDMVAFKEGGMSGLGS